MRTMCRLIAGALFMACSEVENFDNESEEVDLKSVAELIVANELTEEEFQSLGLSESEVTDLIFEVGYIHGLTQEELEREFFSESPMLRSGPCDQVVEKADLSGDTYSSAHYHDVLCDDDPGDTDWLYDFYPSWADDPDDYRWWANDWWIRTVFGGAYSGELKGDSLCTSPVKLCLGTTGVTVAGGANAVANNLFISH